MWLIVGRQPRHAVDLGQLRRENFVRPWVCYRGLAWLAALNDTVALDGHRLPVMPIAEQSERAAIGGRPLPRIGETLAVAEEQKMPRFGAYTGRSPFTVTRVPARACGQ